MDLIPFKNTTICASVLKCCQDLFCIVALRENIFYEWFSLFEWTYI